jgi:hypothetical protein
VAPLQERRRYKTILEKLRRFSGGGVSKSLARIGKDKARRERKKSAEGEEEKGGEKEGLPFDPIWAVGALRAHQRPTSLAGSHRAMCPHLLGDDGIPRLVVCTRGGLADGLLPARPPSPPTPI